MVAKHPKVGVESEREWREGVGLILLQQSRNVGSIMATYTRYLSTPPSPPPPHTHTQNAEVGEKEVWYSSRLLMEGADAKTLSVGETVTLMNWGNVVITTLDKWVARRPLLLLGDHYCC